VNYDLDLRPWSRQGQRETQCHMSRSKIISFESYPYTRTQPIALSGPLIKTEDHGRLGRVGQATGTIVILYQRYNRYKCHPRYEWMYDIYMTSI